MNNLVFVTTLAVSDADVIALGFEPIRPIKLPPALSTIESQTNYALESGCKLTITSEADFDELTTNLARQQYEEDVISAVSEWQNNNPAFNATTKQSLANHLASEIGELFSALHDLSVSELNVHLQRGMSKKVDKPERELADVFFIVVHLASKLGVDLRLEIAKKLLVNKNRKWKPSVGGLVEGG